MNVADQASRLNEYGPIRVLVLSGADVAYRDQGFLDATWRGEEFLDAPDFEEALSEYRRFADFVGDAGPEVHFLPADARASISAIYVRDSSIVAPGGVILCNMKNDCRRDEPAVAGEFFAQLGLPVVGSIADPGTLEGGDFVWLDDRTCAVAHGYRTNGAGIGQLKDLLGADVHVEVVPLPHHNGPAECLHLMSIISPLDRDLALVYSPLMPIPFRAFLLDRGIGLVEVPDEEFSPTMGCNVLAVAPRKCLVLDGNPVTRARLEAAGCEVMAYKGVEISIKGCGGPTCLTRPLIRG